MPHTQDLRKGRYSHPHQIYHVTTVTHERQPLFKDFALARRVIQTLKTSDALSYTHTLAFVVMPDHVHWLFSLGDRGTLAQAVAQFKRNSASGQTWQKGYHDHAVRAQEDVKHIARYIVANPLRAGLVSRLGDYPHWDAVWL